MTQQPDAKTVADLYMHDAGWNSACETIARDLELEARGMANDDAGILRMAAAFARRLKRSSRIAPHGWNTTSNARRAVLVRDYMDTLSAQIGATIEARVLTDNEVDLYGLGREVLALPHVKSLIDFALERIGTADGEDAAK